MPHSLVSAKPDQFNSIHEKLIAKWKDIDPYLSKPIYFAGPRQPRRPAHRHLSPRHRPAGRPRHPPDVHARDRLERRAATLPRPRRTPHVLHLQALPLGGHAPGGVRPPRHRHLPQHPLDRAHLEDAPLQQRHPAHPLAALPQPRAPPRSPLRAEARPTPCATTSASR